MHVNPMEKGWKPPPQTTSEADHRQVSPPEIACPRCGSSNTKFCYYNNYSLTQPRYYCKGCRRYWTKGGSLRNVPVGGGCRKARRGTKNVFPISSRVAGLGRNGVMMTTTAAPARKGDQGPIPNIDLALVYANFLNQKPEMITSCRSDFHHPQIEIPFLQNVDHVPMSFEFPCHVPMSQLNVFGHDPLNISYDQSSSETTSHFTNAFLFDNSFDHQQQQQTDYHFVSNNSSSVENGTNNYGGDLQPLPGGKELNINATIWSGCNDPEQLLFPSQTTVDATPLSAAAAAASEEPKQFLGENNNFGGSQLNVPIELCNFLGLD